MKWFGQINQKDLIKPFYTISEKNAGAVSQRKIRQVKNILFKNKADYLLVTAPENVAWVLNIRGHDTLYSPVPNARLLIGRKGELKIFTNIKKLKTLKNIKANVIDEKLTGKILGICMEKKFGLIVCLVRCFSRIY